MKRKWLATLAVSGLLLGASACATKTEAVAPYQPDPSLGNEFSNRPIEPRLVPVDPNDPDSLTEEQIAMLSERPDYNIYTTLAHHPDLYRSWSPLGRMLLNNDAVSLRHREMAMLRMCWLCQAEYEWSQHARIAHDNVGMTPEEIRDIAVGVEAGNWSELDKAVLNMADELRYDARVSDETWEMLTSHYTEPQVVGLIYTSLQYQLVSMVLNSFGVQLDPVLDFRLPDDLPMPYLAGAPSPVLRYETRVPALTRDEMSDAQLALLPERLRESGDLPNFYATLVRYPDLFSAQLGFARFLLAGTDLTPREREIIILRTTALHGGAYEWSHHVPRAKSAGLSDTEIEQLASGELSEDWSGAESLLIQAVEDLRREAFITDRVYTGLGFGYSEKQIVEIIYLSGGYAMFSSVMNTLGVETELGYPAFGEAE